MAGKLTCTRCEASGGGLCEVVSRARLEMVGQAGRNILDICVGHGDEGVAFDVDGGG